jgi:SAM-dependent methyltransferase
MDRDAWNVRYSEKDLVWGAEPNRFVAEVLGGREAAGRALDLACGEGRNAIWLARRGWRVTAVDLSDVAIERAQRLAADAGLAEDAVEWLCADLRVFEPEPAAFALVLVSYLQVPGDLRRRVLAKAAAAVAPGGELFMIGHALRNRTEGFGGPRDPEVLWDPEQLASEVGATGLQVERCREVLRPVQAEGGPAAIDVLLEARRAGQKLDPGPALRGRAHVASRVRRARFEGMPSSEPCAPAMGRPVTGGGSSGRVGPARRRYVACIGAGERSIP